MIELRADNPRESAMWRAVLELSERIPRGWTLVGAQMVALHAFERGRLAPRPSLYADILVNVRIAGLSTRKFCRDLGTLGFELDGVSPEGLGHRFKKGAVSLDVLAPDGLSARTSLATAGGARTLAIPGGSQALLRTKRVEVELDGDQGTIPRPDLLGAILLKARAIEVDDAPDAQRGDLMFLLCLVDDPRNMKTKIKRGERKWLGRRRELLDGAPGRWSQSLSPAQAEDARLALRILIGS